MLRLLRGEAELFGFHKTQCKYNSCHSDSPMKVWLRQTRSVLFPTPKCQAMPEHMFCVIVVINSVITSAEEALQKVKLFFFLRKLLMKLLSYRLYCVTFGIALLTPPQSNRYCVGLLDESPWFYGLKHLALVNFALKFNFYLYVHNFNCNPLLCIVSFYMYITQGIIEIKFLKNSQNLKNKIKIL